VEEQGEQNDDRDWNAQEPKKNAFTHCRLLLKVSPLQRVTPKERSRTNEEIAIS
jgi:hypothetical protein